MSRTVFALVCAAVLLSMSVSANLLTMIGIDYAQPGGLPFVKFHPASYLLALALLLHARRGRVRAARTPALAGFLVLLAAATAYATLTEGVSGAAVYVESDLVAGVLALLCLDLDPARGRAIGLLVVLMAALNVLIGLGELACGRHLVPVYLGAETLVDAPGEFRGAALYDHPLTGAAITMIAIFLTIGLRPRPRLAVPVLLVLGCGLLSFGGRAALGTTAIALAIAGAWTLGRAMLHRRIDPAKAALLAGCGLLVPVAAATLLLTTAIGERIADKLYLDPSAQSRSVEWRVLGLLDPQALLFGNPISETPNLVYRIGLRYAFTGIESFWLMALLNLGLVGFTLYVTGFVSFAAHLWRRAAPAGRLALVSLLLVASTSNSLGRKSNLLLVLVAAIAALPRRRDAAWRPA